MVNTRSKSSLSSSLPRSERIELVSGDITKLEVDAIVNAANSSLRGGGGVDGAIHRASGPELLEECKTLGRCETGDAKSTKGYKLLARYVIHTVGPVYTSSKHDKCEQQLASCYTRSLEEAKRLHCSSVAFPNISTGVYGYPKDQACRTALVTVRTFLDSDAEVCPEYCLARI
ncbi:hypothetical protein E5Q_04949 [Mixia osmundae IAM 14324]|uniref:Macro domain-containing protein n=1 Tax=Mixia osmundae (strain CBS 9802 / IAM 14324 / JCM 22182 / KY 12970) TaxID=764103 RepID=G7E606_MIXOS|nr:hypothetical protein E5Q_04949 [Mixia osmundae IAM 14324]